MPIGPVVGGLLVVIVVVLVLVDLSCYKMNQSGGCQRENFVFSNSIFIPIKCWKIWCVGPSSTNGPFGMQDRLLSGIKMFPMKFPRDYHTLFCHVSLFSIQPSVFSLATGVTYLICQKAKSAKKFDPRKER